MTTVNYYYYSPASIKRLFPLQFHTIPVFELILFFPPMFFFQFLILLPFLSFSQKLTAAYQMPTTTFAHKAYLFDIEVMLVLFIVTLKKTFKKISQLCQFSSQKKVSIKVACAINFRKNALHTRLPM